MRAYCFLCSIILLSFFTLCATPNDANAAATAIDSSAGVDLPIGAGGKESIVVGAGQKVPSGAVYFLGNVGVGSSTPAAKLDVNGTIKTGGASTGTECSAEGSLAYDFTAHSPVYCSQSKVWTSTNAGAKLKLVSQGTASHGRNLGAHYLCTCQGPQQSGSGNTDCMRVYASQTFANGTSQWFVASCNETNAVWYACFD